MMYNNEGKRSQKVILCHLQKKKIVYCSLLYRTVIFIHVIYTFIYCNTVDCDGMQGRFLYLGLTS